MKSNNHNVTKASMSSF